MPPSPCRWRSASLSASGSLYRWLARLLGPRTGFTAFWLVLSAHVGLAALVLALVLLMADWALIGLPIAVSRQARVLRAIPAKPVL